jgi:hypothetical protein
MNEYLMRAKSTSDASATLLARLKEISKRTCRPSSIP